MGVVNLQVRIYAKIYDVMGNKDLNSKSFIDDVKSIIDSARQNAVRSVDFCRVRMYWDIGKRIFEEEQDGKDRADYGSYLIKNLANKLIPEYGSGFSVRQLERSRQFYRLYPRGCLTSLGSLFFCIIM